jgi:hypothetical protein
MEKRICLTFLFCLILSFFLFQYAAGAQSSSHSISMQGNITYSPLNANLAVIPEDWEQAYGSGPQIYSLDYNVVHTPGKPSFRLGPHTSADVNQYREIDGTWYACKPGDHIRLTVWIKTSPSGGNVSPEQYAPGGRIGLDIYARTSKGMGILCLTPDARTQMGYPGWYYDAKLASAVNGFYWVPWNRDWTQVGWDFIVPSDYCTGMTSPGMVVVEVDPVQIQFFVPILDARPVGDSGTVWFADAELYINPV